MAKHNFRMWAALESAGLTIMGLASFDPRDPIAITMPTSCFWDSDNDGDDNNEIRQINEIIGCIHTLSLHFHFESKRAC